MSNVMDDIQIHIAGERGLVVEFGNIISPGINALVTQFTGLIAASAVHGIMEVVPTYRSVTIYFDPLVISRLQLSQVVKSFFRDFKPQERKTLPVVMVRIPVCYGGVLGPDLEYVAKYTGLSTQDVIKIHTAKPYLVYMLGFTPGFPYLGGLQEELVVPRQKKPRRKVPEGSVGIGGNQTGFYPSESPGEWWLIGRTPLRTFNPKSSTPFLITVGDYVQFVPIELDEYFYIRRKVASDTYHI